MDEQGCTWSAEEVSKADGIVKFSELVSGEYILSEEATLDGFILPEGTWTVTVDAHKDEVKVEKTEKDDSAPASSFPVFSSTFMKENGTVGSFST